MRTFGISRFSLLIAFASPLLAAPPPPLPDASLYQLESEWRDDAGKATRLAELRGKPRVLAMFFSHCDNVCPMITGQLIKLDKEMPAALREKVGFVLVTLDPAGDDPAALADYRKRMSLAPERWTLLRGGVDDTRELANLLGVTYKPKRDDGQIDHDGIIVVLDKDGVVVEKSAGIGDRKKFLNLLKTL
jgi:protein SCO1/2